MIQTIRLGAALILTPLFCVACASAGPDERFAADDCAALSALMSDRNLNAAANTALIDTSTGRRTTKDQITWPWSSGGTNIDKVSKERAAIRKAHRRKTCAP